MVLQCHESPWEEVTTPHHARGHQNIQGNYRKRDWQLAAGAYQQGRRTLGAPRQEGPAPLEYRADGEASQEGKRSSHAAGRGMLQGGICLGGSDAGRGDDPEMHSIFNQVQGCSHLARSIGQQGGASWGTGLSMGGHSRGAPLGGLGWQTPGDIKRGHGQDQWGVHRCQGCSPSGAEECGRAQKGWRCLNGHAQKGWGGECDRWWSQAVRSAEAQDATEQGDDGALVLRMCWGLCCERGLPHQPPTPANSSLGSML